MIWHHVVAHPWLKFQFDQSRATNFRYTCVVTLTWCDYLDKFPRRLETLILVGNPCCEDPDAIQALKTCRPGLEIITEGEDSSPTTREQEDEVVVVEEKTFSDRQFNVDELLKEIVERKCKIDSLQTMNIPHILHVSSTRGMCIMRM